MVTTAQKFALAAAGLAAGASAAIQMQVRYTDNMIDVGTLDYFTATWVTIYAGADSLGGIESDNTYQTDQSTCQTDDAEDLTVQVTMDGSWGAEPTSNVTASAMREAFVSTVWSSLQAIYAQSQYDVYEGCVGSTWQDSVLYTADAACGPLSSVSCEAACSDAETPTEVQCDTHLTGSLLPSKLKITAYEDGVLLADELTVTFAATANDVSDGGCGIVGTISEKLASFVPYVGGLFSEGISFECGDD